MNYTLPETEGLQPRMMSPEEERINKWICGYLCLEEMAESAVQFITTTEHVLSMPVTDSGAGIGERLHKLFAHIILQRTNLFPPNPTLSATLERVYSEVCHRDVAICLQLLASAGLNLIGVQCPKVPEYLLALIPDKAPEDLRQLWEYYAPYFEGINQEKAGKTPQTNQ